MTAESSSIDVAPHWLMRLFGAQAATFSLGDKGLEVRTKSGENYLIEATSLANEATFREGIVFSRLVLQTDCGEKVFPGLRKADGERLFHWLRAHWLRKLAPEIEQVVGKIRALLNKGYPRQSRLDAARVMAEQALQRFQRVPEPQWCSDVDVTPFKWLAAVTRWQEADWEKLRKQYVDRQLARNSAFFDTVENQPLTERQRVACVVDEDNNLVLAGAGTGKTSTMVGRAGFLIASGQARAEDILMLAFANKAAKEMQERIDHRLGKCGITTSTFHKLGKTIIAKVEGEQPSLSPLAEDDKALAWQVSQWFEQHLKTPEY